MGLHIEKEKIMGLYIEDDNKVEWCETHGEYIPNIDVIKQTYDICIDEDVERICCVVDNFHFFTLGVAFDKQELDRFTLDHDKRPKAFFVIPLHKIKEKCPNWAGYIKE